jgi:hypothetical protein
MSDLTLSLFCLSAFVLAALCIVSWLLERRREIARASDHFEHSGAHRWNLDYYTRDYPEKESRRCRLIRFPSHINNLA